MKNNNFDSDSVIQFKALADKIKGIADGTLKEEDFDIDAFTKSGMAEIFSKFLSEELSKPCESVSEDVLYEEIAKNYCFLIKELGVKRFHFFRFSDYNDCRKIILDGKEYDLDDEFYHDDSDADGALCAIDCLMADLEKENEIILKKVESLINRRNQK